jgi:4-hydroxythreonine-4-phosphate dehydrogenase
LPLRRIILTGFIHFLCKEINKKIKQTIKKEVLEMNMPVIGITLGDPCGIGPEIIVKALANEKIYRACHPIVIGDRGILESAMTACGLNIDMEINVIDEPIKGKYRQGCIDLIDLKNINIKDLKIGRVCPEGGKAAFEYIKKAVEFAGCGSVDAIATGPINKESLKAANISYIGHTEILAGLTNTVDPLTIFEVRGMKVFFLTRHISLTDACNAIKYERILDYIIRCTAALSQLGVKEGTMAVAGLNPHNGEHGLFGDTEAVEIEPAVNEARRRGYNVEGPVSADSVFYLTLNGKYNSVLSLYHDQGHIATKTLDFERTIAITSGLPFLRTSVDHGTAMNIVGQGIASSVSMEEAILLAAKYSPYFKGTG